MASAKEDARRDPACDPQPVALALAACEDAIRAAVERLRAQNSTALAAVARAEEHIDAKRIEDVQAAADVTAAVERLDRAAAAVSGACEQLDKATAVANAAREQTDQAFATAKAAKDARAQARALLESAKRDARALAERLAEAETALAAQARVAAVAATPARYSRP